MKPCNGANGKLISRYVDNDLTQEELAPLQRHLFTCKACGETLDSYVKIKKMICTGFPVTENFALEQCSTPLLHPKHQFVPFTQWAYGLAAVIILSAVLISGFLMHLNSAQQSPGYALINTMNSTVMNTPLGSLVYYQEFAGSAVHSQFVNIATAPTIDAIQENETWTQNALYESPLFGDDISDNRFSTE